MRRTLSILTVLLAASLIVPVHVNAQLLDRLKKKAEQRAEREADRQMDAALDKTENAVRCSVGDDECVRKAKSEGQDVVIVDDDGEVVGEVSEEAETADVGALKPGEGVWANYDFVPGSRVLFADDFADDRVGDFPRRMEFVEGNAEVVEWQGANYLRASAKTILSARLPEELPDRFTIEFDFFQEAGHMHASVVTEDYQSGHFHQYDKSYFSLGNRSGVFGPRESATTTAKTKEVMTPVRIQVDGAYVKMYLDEQRVANIPRADVARSATVQFRLLANENNPAFLGKIRIAAGGREMYDALIENGRVSTRGIHFDTGSARIRPESTPTLRDIGEMLEDHPDLRLMIEGHTDDVGEEDYNQSLSEQRADAVRLHLIETFDIDSSRLESAGFGESKPVDDNATPEARQNNRRVDLVLL